MIDLQEQLQENLISYLSMLSGVDLDDDRDHVIDDICQIVVDTFRASLEDKYGVPSGWTGTTQL